MLQYARRAQAFAAGYTFDLFMADAKTQAACLHSVRTVGEAASQIPPTFRKAHPEIPWKEVIGVRQKMTHGYDDIDWDVVWKIIVRDLPALESLLVDILSKLMGGQQF